MSTLLAPTHRYFLDGHMDHPEMIDLADGHLVVFSCACPGKAEPNDDSAAVIQMPCGATVMAVADGVGGGPLGYKASAIAMQCLVESLVGSDSQPRDLRPVILDGIEKANSEILDMGTGSATTISVVEVRDQIARGYQVGDSMTLIVGQRGAVRWKSISHSPVGYAIESGMIDEAEAMHHDERHIVSNLVGTRDMHIEIGPVVVLSPLDSIVVASDGLFDNLLVDEVCSMARVGRPLDRMKSLVALASQRMEQDDAGMPGKPDDIAVLLMTP